MDFGTWNTGSGKELSRIYLFVLHLLSPNGNFYPLHRNQNIEHNYMHIHTTICMCMCLLRKNNVCMHCYFKHLNSVAVFFPHFCWVLFKGLLKSLLYWDTRRWSGMLSMSVCALEMIVPQRWYFHDDDDDDDDYGHCYCLKTEQTHTQSEEECQSLFHTIIDCCIEVLFVCGRERVVWSYQKEFYVK